MKKLVFISFLICLVFSCRKELKTPGWEIGVLAPLVHSDMGIEDIIADSLLMVNGDSSLTLVFDKLFYSLTVDSLVNLPDSVFKDTFALPVNVTVAPGQTYYNQTEEKKLALNGPELTNLILKQGYLDYKITSKVNDTTIFKYTMVSATQNSQVVLLQVTVPPGTTVNPSVVTGSYNLANANFDLTGINFNQYNTYVTNLQVSVAPGTTGTVVGPNNKIFLETSFYDLIPSYAKGYFGQQNSNVPLSTTNFDFFKNFQTGTLDINAINANIYLSNGIGVDARIKIDTVSAYNSSNFMEVFLNHSDIGNDININRATNNTVTAIPYVYNMLLNNGNSNIDFFLENLPDVLKYKMNFEINPLGNVSNHTDFLFENSRIDAGIHAEIPLDIIAQNISLRDTIPFDLDKFDGNGKLLQGTIKLHTENGFPLSANLNITMLDENFNPVGMLVSNLNIGPGAVNGFFIVTNPLIENFDIAVNSSNVALLYQAKYLVINPQFSTVPNTQHLKIYDYYRFKSSIVVDVDYLTQN
jgi:hypothetical protein